MNQTIISGNLTADIETRSVGEQHLSKFTLACNEGDRVVFLPVESWNMPHLAEYLFKGSKVLVSGSLKQDTWESKDGEARSRILLVGFKVEFLTSKDGDASRVKTSTKAGSAQRPSGRPGRRQAASN
ncbi:MAG: single-stranded DNA-binding protein [Lentimonas sp.]